MNSLKRTFVSFVLLMSLAPAWSFDLPAQFVVKEKFFAIGNDFEIYTGDEKKFVGKIVERIFNLTTTFELFDEKGELVAKARSRFWALGSTIDVSDVHGAKIGTVKENILKSFFKVTTTYSVSDAQGKVLGSSEKLDLFSTQVSVKDSSGHQVFFTKRPFINLVTDKWNSSFQGKSIDPRLVVFIPAYKTAADNYRKSQE